MGDDSDGVSPRQVGADYVMVHRASACRILAGLLALAPTCNRRGCKRPAIAIVGGKRRRCYECLSPGDTVNAPTAAARVIIDAIALHREIGRQ